MKIILALLFTIIHLLFYATASAQSDIVNSWVVAGKLSQGEAFPIGSPQKYIFLSDNKYRIYDSTSLTVLGNYQLAADGKSFLLKGRQTSLSVKIINLTPLEMQIVYDIPIALSDTMVLYVAGTPMAAIAQKKYNKAPGYFKDWIALKEKYKSRSDLTDNIIALLKKKLSGSDSIISIIRKSIIKADQLVLNNTHIPKINVVQYSFVQENLSDEINELLRLADNDDNIKSDKLFLDLKLKLEAVEKEIQSARSIFNLSFKAYYGF